MDKTYVIAVHFYQWTLSSSKPAEFDDLEAALNAARELSARSVGDFPFVGVFEGTAAQVEDYKFEDIQLVALYFAGGRYTKATPD